MKQEYEKYNSYIKINLDNLSHNLELVRKNAGSADILAVIKANAYNHGADVVSNKLYRCGVRHFAVANIDEALELRKSGLCGMILVLSPIPSERYIEACENDISVTADSLHTLNSISDFVKGSGQKIKIHLALNTGMNRIGFDSSCDGLSNELCMAAKAIMSEQNIIPEGIFSHLCIADGDDRKFTELQMERFDRTVKALSDMPLVFKFRHLCNSAGVINFESFRYDLVRGGIVLYGGEFLDKGALPVMSFHSKISAVRNVKKGETVGYGRTFTAERDMTVATVCAGYADGYPRLLSGKGEVLCHGKRFPVIGRVCMDMFMIDVSGVDGICVNDEVTLFGKDGNESITAGDIAELCGTISYEILCCAGKRSGRFYIENNT